MKAIPRASASRELDGATSSPASSTRPLSRSQDAAQDVHGRRLAGAVFTNEAENGALGELESDVAQHLDAEEAFVEPADLEKQLGHR